MEGWIKLHRRLIDWEWYSDSSVRDVFIHLLLIANHKEVKYRGESVPAGCVITSTDRIAHSLGLSRQQVRTALKKLQSTGEINQQTTNRNSIINIVNYSLYQGLPNDEQPTNNQQITNKQPTNNQQITIKQPTSNQPSNKNVKNVKNVNKYISNTEDDCACARERLAAEFTEYSEVARKTLYPNIALNITSAEASILRNHIDMGILNRYLFEAQKDHHCNDTFETVVEWAERDGLWQ